MFVVAATLYFMYMAESELREIVRLDPRYPIEAYEFLLRQEDLLAEAQESSAIVIISQICEAARSEFAFLARVIFHVWGFRRPADLGEALLNLAEANLIPWARLARRDFDLGIELGRKLQENSKYLPRRA